MSEQNKAILEKGNAAITSGNTEGFMSCCTDDMKDEDGKAYSNVRRDS